MISLRQTPYLIADVGSNWKRGKTEEEWLACALRHIDDGARCGVSAVKFQFYTHKELYGVDGDDTYALPYHFLPKLSARCQSRNIDFLCTAFSREGVGLVDPFVPMHKIASCEMSDLSIVGKALDTGKIVLVSTGCHHTAEIGNLIAWVERRSNENDICLLECVAAYPAKAADYNFNCVKLQKQFGVSDHTISNTLALTAVGLGASVFEKHYDAMKIDLPINDTPDSGFALSSFELRNYCSQIIEAFGVKKTLHKMTTPSEEPVKLKSVRRLKVTQPLKGGQDVLDYGVNYGSFRSLEVDTRAANPFDWERFDGKRVKRDMKPQEGLWFDDIE